MILNPCSMCCTIIQQYQLDLDQAWGHVHMPFESSLLYDTELGHVLTAEGWTILVLCRGGWSDGTPFAGTSCAWTFLNQRWAKWVYIGSVLCYVSVTFFILLYQLIRNLRAISVMLHGLEVCVSVVFFWLVLCTFCVCIGGCLEFILEWIQFSQLRIWISWIKEYGKGADISFS